MLFWIILAVIIAILLLPVSLVFDYKKDVASQGRKRMRIPRRSEQEPVMAIVLHYRTSFLRIYRSSGQYWISWEISENRFMSRA